LHCNREIFFGKERKGAFNVVDHEDKNSCYRGVDCSAAGSSNRTGQTERRGTCQAYPEPGRQPDQLPTKSDKYLGNDNWGAGVSGVVLHLEKGSPWVYGVLVNNIWSLSDEKQGDSYSNGLIQPFLNYNFEGGLYLTSAPIATVDWQADSGDKWIVPIGGGVGKIFHLGKLPINTSLQAYNNVVSPQYGPDWQIRFQVQFLFPK
jgi:hypothetical protein